MSEVRALGDRGLPALKGVSLAIRAGEILGVAGVAGNGQSELAEVVAGLRPVQSGALRLEGAARGSPSPRQAAGAGVGHIPEDRLGQGLFAGLPVPHNAILRAYRAAPVREGLRLNREAATRFAAGLVQRADVRSAGLGARVGSLSGGNQQKLLARREIEVAARLLIAVHPTRGLDVAATEAIRHELLAYRDQGRAVLLISEDLDEVLHLSDRVAVMFAGRIAGEFDRANARREEIGLLMGGSAAGRGART
jgi:simple sugar transport system ATP-binding protein